MKRTVLLFDAHSPFEDKQLWRLILDYLIDLYLTEEDEVILGGDLADHWSVSAFDNSSTREEDVQSERVEVREFLKRLTIAARKAKIIYLEGNHERRWGRFLSSGDLKKLEKVPELQFKSFFGLDKLDIEVKVQHKPNPTFLVTHGFYYNKYPARKELSEGLISGCSGHAHRNDRAYRRGHEKRLMWHSFGHLADKSEIDEHCKFSTPLKWDQSFGLLLSDRDKWDLEVMHCDGGFYSKYLRKRYG